MKKAFLMLLLLFACTLFACSSDKITIEGNDKIEIGFEYEYKAIYKGNELSNDEVDWIIDNENVASIVDNKIRAINGGTFTLKVVLKEDGSVYGSKTITIINAVVESIKIKNTKTSIYQEEQIILNCIIGTEDGTTDQEIIWSVDKPELASIDGAGDSAALTALKPGTVIVSVKCSSATDTYQIEIIEVIKDIEYYGYDEMAIDTCFAPTFNIEDPVITILTDNIEYKDGYFYALSEGVAVFNVKSKKNNDLSKDISINVTSSCAGIDAATTEEQELINSYLESMTVEEKIGQMIMVNLYLPGLSGGMGWRSATISVENDNEGLYYTIQQNNNVPSEYRVEEQFNGYLFGNFTYNSLTTSSSSVAINFAKGMQNYFIDTYNFGGIVGISDNSDYNYMGSLVSSYVDNLELGTLNSEETLKKYYTYLANDLSDLGITMYNAPAYFYQEYTSDNYSYAESKNVLYSSIEKALLEDYNVNLSPMYTLCSNSTSLSNKSRLDKAISNKIESITFTDYSKGELMDGVLPVQYLRNNGYNGIIMNIGRGDDASYYKDAIEKGVNMFEVTLYLNNPTDRNNEKYQNYNTALFSVLDELIRMVNSGEISMDKVNDSVSKVLLYKIRNGIMDGIYPEDEIEANQEASDLISTFSNNGNLISINHEFTGVDKTNSVYAYAAQDTYGVSTCQLITNVKKTGYTNFVLSAIDEDTISIDNTYESEESERIGLDRITSNDTVILFIRYNEVDWQTVIKGETEEEDQYINHTVYWTDLIEEFEKKTSNIILVFLNDPLLGEKFNSSYPQVYLNYNYTKGYTLVFNVLENGTANGCNIYSK